MITNNLNLLNLSVSDSAKESIINENFFMLDSLVSIKALRIVISTTNLISLNGDVYLVSNTPDETLIAYKNCIMIYHANFGYKFIDPKEGMVLFVVSELSNYIFDSGAWTKVQSGSGGGSGTINNIDDNIEAAGNKTWSIDKLRANFLSITNANTNFLKIVDATFAKINDSLENSLNKTWSIDKIKGYIVNNQVDASGFYIGDYKQSTQSSNHGRWLLCNGQAILRSTYSALFALLGTSFGLGDNSTTFNLPDFRGRVFGSIGQGTGLINRSLGQSIGEENHLLTINEIPSHKHSLFTANSAGAVPQRQSLIVGSTGITATGVYKANDVSSVIDNAGNDQVHNNMQPTLFAGNTFIFSGV